MSCRTLCVLCFVAVYQERRGNGMTRHMYYRWASTGLFWACQSAVRRIILCDQLFLCSCISVNQPVRYSDHTLASAVKRVSVASFRDLWSCHHAHLRQFWERHRRDEVNVKDLVQLYTTCHHCTEAECTVQADGGHSAQAKGLNFS